MSYNEFCEHCGKELNMKWGEGLRFCDDKCRFDWHNTKRKMQRKLDTITKCLFDLLEIADISESWMIEVGDTMKSIKSIVENGDGYEYHYKCIKCGQHRFGIPTQAETCKECQSASDKFKLIEIKTFASPTNDETVS